MYAERTRLCERVHRPWTVGGLQIGMNKIINQSILLPLTI